MKEPVDHVLRPKLPWRDESALTECGYDASKVSALTREDYFARFKEMGQQRCALLTCMTCGDTARRWVTWEDDPRKALEREIQWETAWSRDKRGVRLRDELQVIAALIQEHREEFEERVASTEQRREWLAQKAAHAAAKKAPDHTKGRGL